jgi:hypothetical protein
LLATERFFVCSGATSHTKSFLHDIGLCEVNEVEAGVLESTCKAFSVGGEDLLQVLGFVKCDDGKNGQSDGEAKSDNDAKDISAPSIIVLDWDF